MRKTQTNSEHQPPENPEAISKWARAYAQNRSLGVVVFMIVFVVLCAAIAGPSYLAGEAYRSGNMPVFWVSLAVLASAVGAVIYFSIPHWGGKVLERITRRLYANEGRVAFSVPAEHKRVWGFVLIVSFLACIVASVVIDFVFAVPSKYMQPISALYVVPFLVGLWLRMRPMAGRLALLWPALYAIHAILIVAGAPILFTGPWQGLNMLVPIAGYGLLSALVQHLYSRFALARLKGLSRTRPAGSGRSEEGGQ
jgi:hypothetical protein